MDGRKKTAHLNLWTFGALPAKHLRARMAAPGCRS
jgi:hypothetical protein